MKSGDYMQKTKFQRNVALAAGIVAVALAGIVIVGIGINSLPQQDHIVLNSNLTSILKKPVDLQEKTSLAREEIMNYFPVGARLSSLAMFVEDSGGECTSLEEIKKAEKGTPFVCSFIEQEKTGSLPVTWTLIVELDSRRKLLQDLEVKVNAQNG